MTSTPGLGHNSGFDPNGYSGRLHQWRRARAELIPRTMPLEVVRLRVRRAERLGLDYRTYAGIRATTGRDIVALLFSSNALGMIGQAHVPEALAARLSLVEAERGVLIHAPLSNAEAPAPLDWAEVAPLFTDSWTAMRGKLAEVLRSRRLPPDGVLMIGDTAFEREWCAAIRAAGYVTADRYFAT
ncbi:MAG: hypothetical protein AAF919_17955 [Pseudomonadota bacterium]